jgi:hypothetical protein
MFCYMLLCCSGLAVHSIKACATDGTKGLGVLQQHHAAAGCSRCDSGPHGVAAALAMTTYQCAVARVRTTVAGWVSSACGCNHLHIL